MSKLTISKTETAAITVGTTPVTVLAGGPEPRVVRVLSNRFVFVRVGNSAVADEGDSYPVPEMTEVFFNVAANAEVSAVAATGETSGSVWVTEV
jgi:hypothetical protein